MTSTRDREYVAALTAGLAATVAVWSCIPAFAPTALDALAGHSPWFFGPASTAAWALFSGIAYALLRRSQRARPSSNEISDYRCRELAIMPAPAGPSVCANREEKRRLAAVTAGFALTLSSWVAALSFLPDAWLDTLDAAPAWFYCLISVALWLALSAAMRAALEASDRRLELSRTQAWPK